MRLFHLFGGYLLRSLWRMVFLSAVLHSEEIIRVRNHFSWIYNVLEISQSRFVLFRVKPVDGKKFQLDPDGK